MFSDKKGNLKKDDTAGKKFWIIAGVTFVISLAVCLAIYFNLPKVQGFYDPVANDDQLRFIVASGVCECIICAVGFSWLIAVGTLLPAVPQKIKLKITVIYVCCSFFLISWFPHITLHTYLAKDPWGTIALDFAFHWTIIASSTFLGTFFYTFLKKLSGYKNHKKILSKEFYATETFFVASVTIVLGIIFCAGVQRAMQPSIPSTPQQNACLIFIGIVEAFVSGFGFAFLVGSSVLISRLKDKSIKWKAISAVIAIWWLLSSWWFHTRLHGILPTIHGINPSHWILTEIFFHWTTIIAAIVVCYNMFGLIQLAQSAGKFASRTHESRKAHSSSVKSGSDSVDIPMGSMGESTISYAEESVKEESKDEDRKEPKEDAKEDV